MKAILTFVIGVCIGFLLHPSTGLAEAEGTIVHLAKGKYGPYAVVKGGINQGFTKGIKICIVDDKDEKLACGEVFRSNNNASAIVMPEEEWSMLRKGLKVRLEIVEDLSKSEEVIEEVVKEAIIIAKQPARLSLNYIYGAILPIQYLEPEFNLDARVSGTGSPWKADNTRKSSPVGLGFTYDIPMSLKHALAVGMRYQYLPQVSIDNDYNPSPQENYLVSTNRSHIYSLTVDSMWNVWERGSMLFVAGGGLHLHRSDAFFKMETKASGTIAAETIADVTSSLMATSVSLSSQFHYKIATWYIALGLEALVPVAEFGASSSGEVAIADSIGDTAKDLDGFTSTIEHKKSSFAANALLSIGKTF